MEPRPPQSRTNQTPGEPTPAGDAGPPEQAPPEATSVFRPDYGPVARVPPTGDPINLRPAPPAEVPPPAPRRQSRALWFAVLAGIGIIVVLLVATIATVAWISSGNDNGNLDVAGAAPTQTREAEMALVAGLQTQVATAATPTEAPTQASLLPAPTELPPTETAAEAVATVTTAGAPVATATAAPDDPVEAGAGLAEGTTVEGLLPVADDVPAGMVVTDDTALSTIDEVAAAFGDPADATAQLQAWGWEANASRTFELPEGTDPPANGMTFVYVSVHQFGSDGAAREALTYFADELVAFRNLVEADVGDVGETARGLVGPIDGGSEEGALYVQQGPFLIRISTVAAEGEALGVAVDEAQTILARAEQV